MKTLFFFSQVGYAGGEEGTFSAGLPKCKLQLTNTVISSLES